ncbi:hypothetical protein LXL04_004238 [Taraxacum kok-saghyz]
MRPHIRPHQYAELKPVPCLTYSDAQMLREKCATPILKQVRDDVIRFRYGDEQHLEEALKRIFQYGLGGGVARRNAPIRKKIREEGYYGYFWDQQRINCGSSLVKCRCGSKRLLWQWFVHNLGLFLKWFSKEIIQGIEGRFWIRCLGIYSTGFIFWDYFCINFCLSLNKSFCIFGPKDFLKGIEGFECTEFIFWDYFVWLSLLEDMSFLQTPKLIDAACSQKLHMKHLRRNFIRHSVTTNVLASQSWQKQISPFVTMLVMYVTYQIKYFLDKNKDDVVAEHQALLNASKCPFVANTHSHQHQRIHPNHQSYHH